MRRWALLVAALSSLGGCEGCGSVGPKSLTVFAASSLTDAFGALGRDFESANPGVHVTLALAGSQALRLQIEQGAPADVFASANRQHMRALHRGEHVEAPLPFAANQLALVVPRDNPSSLEALGDLPNARRVVLGAPQVPIGRYTSALLGRSETIFGAGFAARVRARVVSEEHNVRLVLAKVALGEADAAIVYRTDARGAGDQVRELPIPDELAVPVEYQVAVVEGGPNPELARSWVDYVHSAAGQTVLARHGFLPSAGSR